MNARLIPSGQQSRRGGLQGWRIWVKSWASKRPKIMMSLIEMESLLPSSLCVHCRKDQAHVRCRQCGLKDIMCVKCDDEVHRRNPFHDRDIYYEGFFKPVAPSVSLDSEGNLTTVGK